MSLSILLDQTLSDKPFTDIVARSLRVNTFITDSFIADSITTRLLAVTASPVLGNTLISDGSGNFTSQSVSATDTTLTGNWTGPFTFTTAGIRVVKTGKVVTLSIQEFGATTGSTANATFATALPSWAYPSTVISSPFYASFVVVSNSVNVFGFIKIDNSTHQVSINALPAWSSGTFCGTLNQSISYLTT